MRDAGKSVSQSSTELGLSLLTVDGKKMNFLLTCNERELTRGNDAQIAENLQMDHLPMPL